MQGRRDIAGFVLLLLAAFLYYCGARSHSMLMTVVGSGSDVARDRFLIISAVLTALFLILFRESIRYVRARTAAGGSERVRRAVEFGAIPLASAVLLLGLPNLFVSGATDFRVSMDMPGVAGAALFAAVLLVLKDAAVRGMAELGLPMDYQETFAGSQRINFLDFPPASERDFLPLDTLGSLLLGTMGWIFLASL